jgi:anti-sigma B factor antagonist
MPGRAFSATVDKEGVDTVIHLSGDVNRGAEAGLGAASQEAKDGPGRLLFDYTDVDYINSTGIALIVGVLAQARAMSREVGAYGLTEHYRELFKITRLSDFMRIYDSEHAATAAGN